VVGHIMEADGDPERRMSCWRSWQTQEAGVRWWLSAGVGGREGRSTPRVWGAAGHRCDDGHDPSAEAVVMIVVVGVVVVVVMEDTGQSGWQRRNPGSSQKVRSPSSR